MTDTSINFGGVVVHVRPCPACERGRVEVCPRGHGVCDCTGINTDCETCGGLGEVADEDCGCEACASHLCMEHYGEVRERCETCLEEKANEVMRGFWAALREQA